MSDDLKEASPQPESRPNQPGESAMRVLQRTANAISPWVRKWWVGGGNATAAATSGMDIVQRSVQPGRIPGQSPLALRVQRSVAFASDTGRSAELADRFSQSIVQRHAVAEHIERRYRNEPRQLTTPPGQLPLPGLQTTGRIQRASNEMSIEDFARSFSPPPGHSAQTVASTPSIQRTFDPSLEGAGSPSTTFEGSPIENVTGQSTRMSDMQEAVRRAAQIRPAAPPQSSSPPPVQRSDDPNSIVATIEERIRAAREAQSGASTTPPARSQTPPLTPVTPNAPVQRTPATHAPTPGPAVQRAPVTPTPAQPAASAPPSSNSIADAIQARIRASRERVAGGGTTDAAPSAPSMQRSEPVVQRSVAAPFEEDAQEEPVPTELPFTPTADRASPGFSKAEAIRNQVNEGIRRKAEEATKPKAPPTAEEIQRMLDPASPTYTKAEVIRRRIEGNQVYVPPPQFSVNPDDQNYSKAEVIRRRIAEASVQRSATETSGNAPSTPPVAPAPQPPPSAPAADAPVNEAPSLSQQIRDRIQTAREQGAPGNLPPTPNTTTPPVTPPTTPQSSTVQRAPDERITIQRDMQLKPSPLASGNAPPQAQRVRALSRSQIMTPERKTGDFLAGEPPRPGTVPKTATPVQRTPAEPPAPSTPTAAPTSAASEPLLPTMIQREVETDEEDREDASVQRSVDPALSGTESSSAEVQAAIPTSNAQVPDMVQRTTEMPSTSLPMPSAGQSVTGSTLPTPEASTPTSVGAAQDVVQRSTLSSAENTPHSIAASEGPESQSSVGDVVQRAEEPRPATASPTSSAATIPEASAEQGTPTAEGQSTSSVASEPSAPAIVQRSVETPTETQPATPTLAVPTQSSTPEVLQRSPDTGVEASESPALSSIPSAPESVQRNVESRTESGPAVVSKPEATTTAPDSAITTKPILSEQGTVQRSVDPTPVPAVSSPAVPVAPETMPEVTTTVQRSGEAFPATTEAQDSVQLSTDTGVVSPTQAVAQSEPISPEIVQRAVADTPQVSQSPAPTPTASTPSVVQRAVDTQPTPPFESTPSSPAPESVQRTVTDAPTVAPTASMPEVSTPSVLQRAVDSRPTQPVDTAPSSPALEPVQRAVDTPAILAVDVTPSLPAPESVQRTEVGTSPVAPTTESSKPPVVQRTVADTPSVAPPVRTQDASTPSVLQRAVDVRPTSAVEATPSSPAPESVQRTEAETHTVAPMARTPDARHTPLVEPTPPSPVGTSIEASAPERVQRASENRAEVASLPSNEMAASTPTPSVASMPETPVQRAPSEAVQRSVVAAAPDVSSPSPAPQATDGTDIDPIVQRSEINESRPSALPSASAPTIPAQSISTPVAPTPLSPTSAPDAIQRKAKGRKKEKVTQDATPLSSAMPSLQRSADDTASAPAPETPTISEQTASVPDVQRTAKESTTKESTAIEPTTIERREAAPAALQSEPVQPVSKVSETPVQGSPQTPQAGATPDAPLAVEPSLQRSPDAQNSEAQDAQKSALLASNTPSVQPQVQRTVDLASTQSPTVKEQASEAEHVQRSPETRPPVSPTVQPSVERGSEGMPSAQVTAGPQSSLPVQRQAEPSADIPTPLASPVSESEQRSTEPSSPAPSNTPPPALEQGLREVSVAPEVVQRMPGESVETPPSAKVSASKSEAIAIQRMSELASTALPESPTPIPPTPISPTTITQTTTTSPPVADWVQRSPQLPSAQGEESISRTDAPDLGTHTVEPAPFRPINRYRDPRVIARAVEPSAPVKIADLSLTSAEPSAILPQARMATSMPLANTRIQRSPATIADGPGPETPDFGIFSAFSQSSGGQAASAPMNVPGDAALAIQRSPQKQGRSKSTKQKSARVSPPSTRDASTIRRSPLPLAKLRSAPGKEVVQRSFGTTKSAKSTATRSSSGTMNNDDVFAEVFSGTSSANSARSVTQAQNLGGGDAVIQRSETGTESTGQRSLSTALQESGENQNETSANKSNLPDLDRLARVILPIIKRMLAVERDRRNPRPLI